MTDVLVNLVREKKNKLFRETQKHFIFHRERDSSAKHLSSVPPLPISVLELFESSPRLSQRVFFFSVELFKGVHAEGRDGKLGKYWLLKPRRMTDWGSVVNG